MRVPLALFGHSENVLSKHGPSAVGSAIQVIGLYSSPSFVQRVTEDMKRFLIEFLSLSNISHFTLRQLPHEDPKVRTILYRIAHIGRSDQSGKCLGAVRNKNCRASHRDRHSIIYGLDVLCFILLALKVTVSRADKVVMLRSGGCSLLARKIPRM